MINIKLSTSFPGWPIERQTPGHTGIWENCKFYINKPVSKCDYWVVYEGLHQKDETICQKGKTILVTAEPPTIKQYNKEFLNQFDVIITCHRNIKHNNLIFQQQGLPWHIGRQQKNHTNLSFSKDYDELQSIKDIQKNKLISAIISTKSTIQGHRKRLVFINKLKKSFGNQLDIFGRGVQEIEDKWEGIAPYKYHIVLENSQYNDYWTEKLSDAFLGGAYPFYCGSTNITKYFPVQSFTEINMNDVYGSIQKINTAIENHTYEKAIPYLMEAKDLILNKHNLFPMLAEFCSNNYPANKEKQDLKNTRILPEEHFRTSLVSLIKKNKKGNWD